MADEVDYQQLDDEGESFEQNGSSQDEHNNRNREREDEQSDDIINLYISNLSFQV